MSCVYIFWVLHGGISSLPGLVICFFSGEGVSIHVFDNNVHPPTRRPELTSAPAPHNGIQLFPSVPQSTCRVRYFVHCGEIQGSLDYEEEVRGPEGF